MALYTSKAVAEWLGITDRRVRELRDEGVRSEIRPGVFNMKTVVRQYLTYKLGGKDDQANLTAARAAREQTRADFEQMKLEEARGNLHSTEDVERGIKTMAANFKARLSEIPMKLAGTLIQVKEEAEAYDILNRAIQEALMELSDPDVALAAPDASKDGADDEQEG